MTDPLSIALSGLNVAAKRANAAASNIANAGTSGATEDGSFPAPYAPVDVIETSVIAGDGQPQGVKADIVPRENGATQVYDPEAPYADAQGFIATPDVDFAAELVDIKQAANAYKANIAVIKVANEMEKELFSRFDETV